MCDSSHQTIADCLLQGQTLEPEDACHVSTVEELMAALAEEDSETACQSGFIVLEGGQQYYFSSGSSDKNIRVRRSNTTLISYGYPSPAVVVGSGHTVDEHLAGVLIRGITFIQPADTPQGQAVFTVGSHSSVKFLNNRFVGSGISLSGALHTSPTSLESVPTEDGCAYDLWLLYNEFRNFYFSAVKLEGCNRAVVHQNLFADNVGSSLVLREIQHQLSVEENTFVNCVGLSNIASTYIVSVSGIMKLTEEGDEVPATNAVYSYNVINNSDRPNLLDIGFHLEAVFIEKMQGNVCYGVAMGLYLGNTTFTYITQDKFQMDNSLIRGSQWDMLLYDPNLSTYFGANQEDLFLTASSTTTSNNVGAMPCYVDQYHSVSRTQTLWTYGNLSMALHFCPETYFQQTASEQQLGTGIMSAHIHLQGNQIYRFNTSETLVMSSHGGGVLLTGESPELTVLDLSDAVSFSGRLEIRNLQLSRSSSSLTPYAMIRTTAAMSQQNQRAAEMLRLDNVEILAPSGSESVIHVQLSEEFSMSRSSIVTTETTTSSSSTATAAPYTAVWVQFQQQDSSNTLALLTDNYVQDYPGTCFYVEQAGSWNVSGNRIRDSTGQSPGAVPASVQLSSSASADSDTAVFHFTNNSIYQSKEIRYPRSVGTIVWSRLSGFWLSGPYSSSEQQKQQQQQQHQQQYDWKFEHNQVF